MVKEVASKQVLLPDHSVYSVQWIDLPEIDKPPNRCASFLVERYLVHIRKCTFSLIRPAQTAVGVELRFLGLPLLSFGHPHYEAVNEGERVTLPICGGILVRKDETDGDLSFSGWRRREGVRIQVELAGYHPFLLGRTPPSLAGRMFYRYTQAFIHRLVTVSYLGKVASDLIGKKVRVEAHEQPHQDGLKM